MTGRRNGSTWTYRKNRAVVLGKSTTCHLCGHDQADATDHLKPHAHGGTHLTTNLRPVHHKPCPTCGQTCNMTKGDKPWAPTVVRDSGTFRRP